MLDPIFRFVLLLRFLTVISLGSVGVETFSISKAKLDVF